MVKNYLLSQVDDRLQEAQQKWAQMISILESLGIDDIIMTYLRHFMITQYGPIREKEIFNKIQTEVGGKTISMVFLEKLADYADTYSAILTPTHTKWNKKEYGGQMRDILTVLKDLKVQQIRSLMLAVAQQFSEKEIELAFRSFIFWTVRFLIAGGGGGQLEEAYAQKAHEVMEGKITNAKELFKSLEVVLPTDQEFETAFSTARVSQHYLARYYLRAIEAHMRKESDQPELIPCTRYKYP